MSMAHDSQTEAPQDEVHQAGPAIDDWVPEDRAPSAAESNFLSIALFSFLILFGIGCIIVF